jgi:hypothetical protein
MIGNGHPELQKNWESSVFGLLECGCQTALNSWTANLSLALFVHRTFAPFSSWCTAKEHLLHCLGAAKLLETDLWQPLQQIGKLGKMG